MASFWFSRDELNQTGWSKAAPASFVFTETFSLPLEPFNLTFEAVASSKLGRRVNSYYGVSYTPIVVSYAAIDDR